MNLITNTSIAKCSAKINKKTSRLIYSLFSSSNFVLCLKFTIKTQKNGRPVRVCKETLVKSPMKSNVSLNCHGKFVV